MELITFDGLPRWSIDTRRGRVVKDWNYVDPPYHTGRIGRFVKNATTSVGLTNESVIGRMLRTFSTIGATVTGIIDVERAKLSTIFRFDFLDDVALQETFVVMVGVPGEPNVCSGTSCVRVCAGRVGTQS